MFNSYFSGYSTIKDIIWEGIFGDYSLLGHQTIQWTTSAD
jgi:hypothetical protein